MFHGVSTFRSTRILTVPSRRLNSSDRLFAHSARSSSSTRAPLPALPEFVDARHRAELVVMDAHLRAADEVLRAREHDLTFLLSLREQHGSTSEGASKYRYKNLFYLLAVTAEDMPNLGPLFRLVSIENGIQRKRRLVNRLWAGTCDWLKELLRTQPESGDSKNRANLRLQRHLVADLGDMGRVGISDYRHLADQVDGIVRGLNSLHVLAGLRAIHTFLPDHERQPYPKMLEDIQAMIGGLTKRFRADNRIDEIQPTTAVEKLATLERLHETYVTEKPSDRAIVETQIKASIAAFHAFLDVLDFPFPKT